MLKGSILDGLQKGKKRLIMVGHTLKLDLARACDSSKFAKKARLQASLQCQANHHALRRRRSTIRTDKLGPDVAASWPRLYSTVHSLKGEAEGW